MWFVLLFGPEIGWYVLFFDFELGWYVIRMWLGDGGAKFKSGCVKLFLG